MTSKWSLSMIDKIINQLTVVKFKWTWHLWSTESSDCRMMCHGKTGTVIIYLWSSCVQTIKVSPSPSWWDITLLSTTTPHPDVTRFCFFNIKDQIHFISYLPVTFLGKINKSLIFIFKKLKTYNYCRIISINRSSTLQTFDLRVYTYIHIIYYSLK